MNKQQTSTPSQKDIAISFLMLVATGKVREAFHSYIGPDFRHHNPFFNGDADSLMIAMEENAKQSPNKKVESKLVIEEDDKVVVYSHIKQHPEDLGGAVVHIFRFQNNQIVELWDIGQPIPKDSPNKNGMF
ncbi:MULTISPECIES: nuclear transport factor 2 family protein [Bacillaceae]|uniref:nuclear transport factor 2 family protein n=1 Tax=Bacillaceae TaxID=186817 RepID=UPI000660AC96|nr:MULTISPECIES: nuclear transport factor 2 family protein [Bacillaceae]MCM3362069.1 nuclear transport factor 2 family protein [Niallia sp. MER TA 168]